MGARAGGRGRRGVRPRRQPRRPARALPGLDPRWTSGLRLRPREGKHDPERAVPSVLSAAPRVEGCVPHPRRSIGPRRAPRANAGDDPGISASDRSGPRRGRHGSGVLCRPLLTVRIIAGEFGGRRLTAPRGSSTRPTSDRVREALFSILAESISGARVLDLYAGSGALGLEALSRGALLAVFVERDRSAASTLKDNVTALGLAAPKAIVRVQAVHSFLAANADPFDLVFMDPPYATASASLAAGGGAIAKSLTTNPGLLVVEHASRVQLEPAPGLVAVDRRIYGDTSLAFFRKTDETMTA
ncbi:MAG: 16S rRNA (guanine(966)-N(2))-methyltransferase RsmD [Myxococcales bacterium]|nr:16S rRNA (guanine(966)-N(2))-methyltransferase RsmD [Myxococcales bacterium]